MSEPLQQTLKDLDRAICESLHPKSEASRKGWPKFKAKDIGDGFRILRTVREDRKKRRGERHEGHRQARVHGFVLLTAGGFLARMATNTRLSMPRTISRMTKENVHTRQKAVVGVAESATGKGRLRHRPQSSGKVSPTYLPQPYRRERRGLARAAGLKARLSVASAPATIVFANENAIRARWPEGVCSSCRMRTARGVDRPKPGGLLDHAAAHAGAAAAEHDRAVVVVVAADVNHHGVVADFVE